MKFLHIINSIMKKLIGCTLCCVPANSYVQGEGLPKESPCLILPFEDESSTNRGGNTEEPQIFSSHGLTSGDQGSIIRPPCLQRQTHARCEVLMCGAVRTEYGIGVVCHECGHQQSTHSGISERFGVVTFEYPNQHLIRAEFERRMEELFLMERSRIDLTEDEFQRLMDRING